MEIYRQRVNRVYFEAPAADTQVAATASLNGGTEASLTVMPLNPGQTENPTQRYVDIPYINDEGRLRITWTFNTPTLEADGVVGSEAIKRDTYDVVTPILSDDEIKEIHPNATPAELTRVEKAVRHIINAHTGQRFGRFVGTHKVRATRGKSLSLPARLMSLTSVNGSTDDVIKFDIVGDGWYLAYFPWGVPPVKADYYGLHMHTGGVIHNPNHVKLGEFLPQTYEINGVWGYEEVPSQVTEAAKLLVNDYACGDQAYRDRYLTSMTAADWRIQFHSGAFAKTGNVRADQLLSDFVLQRGWTVV